LSSKDVRREIEGVIPCRNPSNLLGFFLDGLLHAVIGEDGDFDAAVPRPGRFAVVVGDRGASPSPTVLMRTPLMPCARAYSSSGAISTSCAAKAFRGFKEAMIDLAVLGNVTHDVIDGSARLGGSVSYVSMAAARLGMRVGLVTAAPAGFSLMEPLRHVAGMTVPRQDAAAATSFALDYSGPVRRVRLLERGTMLARPALAAPFVFLGPVMGEVPLEALRWFPASRLVIGLQGFLRATDAEGYVIATEPPPAPVFASASAVVFSELDHPAADDLAAALAAHVPIVVVTRAERGATLFDAGKPVHIPASPAVERDPTGAGDVFGAALTAALWRGAPPVDAATQAAYAAARAVEGPGLGNLR
jgi:hypothetical protein